MATTLINTVKTDLGITSNRRDGDIETAVMAAERRLNMIGVQLVEETDDVTVQAVKLYCRSWFNFQGDGERYEKAFEQLANAMAHAGEYRGLEGEGDG